MNYILARSRPVGDRCSAARWESVIRRRCRNGREPLNLLNSIKFSVLPEAGPFGDNRQNWAAPAPIEVHLFEVSSVFLVQICSTLVYTFGIHTILNRTQATHRVQSKVPDRGSLRREDRLSTAEPQNAVEDCIMVRRMHTCSQQHVRCDLSFLVVASGQQVVRATRHIPG